MGCRWGIGLNYNSQNWRLDSSGTWNYGRDVGYGYGVKLGAGSMQLYFNAQWGYDHWTFTDSTGAEYRLDQQVDPATGLASPGSNVWVSSTDGVAVLYDANLRRLYFPSGIFWQFDCASQGIEGDETARYPTLMQDTNGNQILIRYKPAIAGLDTNGNNVYLTWGNSSSRIDQIEDVRGISVGGYVTYQFTYNNDVGVPHLTGITNLIGTSEGYSFDYYPNVALTSPWGAGFGVTSMMKTVTIAGVGLNYLLTYDSNDGYGSALTKVKFPYGGYLRWAYADGTYQGGRSQREVLNRYLSTNGTSELLPYGFSAQHDSALNTIRSQVTLNDASTVGRKNWTFQLLGLPGGKRPRCFRRIRVASRMALSCRMCRPRGRPSRRMERCSGLIFRRRPRRWMGCRRSEWIRRRTCGAI